MARRDLTARQGVSGSKLGHGIWSAVSGCGLVLVDQPTEDWSTPDLAADRLEDRRFRAERAQLQRSMRLLRAGINGQHARGLSAHELPPTGVGPP